MSKADRWEENRRRNEKRRREAYKPYDPHERYSSGSGRSRKKNGCYIATAVYGSYDCPEVWTLRRYRDYYLANRFWGRVFIGVYYSISPLIVKVFGKARWFNRLFKDRLDSTVAKLKSMGYSSDRYEDAD